MDSFFQFQQDQEARYLAAFMPDNASDKNAFIAKHAKFLSDPDKTTKTILVGSEIAGSVAKFVIAGEAEITYWIAKKFWGQGIATVALQELINTENTRPIFGRVAFDNYGSQRVLEKCGFIRVGADTGFASARQAEIEEFIYRLT